MNQLQTLTHIRNQALAYFQETQGRLANVMPVSDSWARYNALCEVLFALQELMAAEQARQTLMNKIARLACRNNLDDGIPWREQANG